MSNFFLLVKWFLFQSHVIYSRQLSWLSDFIIWRIDWRNNRTVLKAFLSFFHCTNKIFSPFISILSVVCSNCLPSSLIFFILLFVLRMKLLPDFSKTFGDFLIIFYIVKQCVFDDLSYINFMKISLQSYFSTISLQFLYSLCSKLLRIFQNSIIFLHQHHKFFFKCQKLLYLLCKC